LYSIVIFPNGSCLANAMGWGLSQEMQEWYSTPSADRGDPYDLYQFAPLPPASWTSGWAGVAHEPAAAFSGREFFSDVGFTPKTGSHKTPVALPFRATTGHLWHLNNRHDLAHRDAGGRSRLQHIRYVTFQMTEVAVPRNLSLEILWLIDELPPPPTPAWTSD
jgi:hypothetical protein